MIDTSLPGGLGPKQTLLKPPVENDLNSNEISQDDAWAVIKAYFQQHGLVSQQIGSFNRFMNFNLQDII